MRYDKKETPKRCQELAQLGMTDIEIAKTLNVGHSTLAKWKKKYPELRKAINDGKMGPDEMVEASLFKKTQYKLTTKEIYEVDEKGKKKLIKTETNETPPSDTACIFWLKNRQPLKWRDRKDIDLTVSQKDVDDAAEQIKNDALNYAKGKKSEKKSN